MKKNEIILGTKDKNIVNRILYTEIQELIRTDTSFLVTEGNGCLYKNYAEKLKNEGYKIFVLNLRNPGASDSWNMLSEPYNLYKKGKKLQCQDTLDDISCNIMLDDDNLKKADTFWAISAKDFLAGLCYRLFEEAPDEQYVHMQSIQNMVNTGTEKFGGSTYLKEFFLTKDSDNYGRQAAMSVLQAPTETCSSILSVFNQKIKSINVKNAFIKNICRSNIDIDTLLTQKSAVFIQIEDEKMELSQYIHVFIATLYERLVRGFYDGKRKGRDFCFVFNDFLSLGRISNIERMLMGSSERNINYIFSIYGISLLEELYSKSIAYAILGSCDKYIVLKNTDLDTLKYFKELSEILDSKYRGKDVTEINLSDGNDIVAENINVNLCNYTVASLEEEDDYKPCIFDIKEWVKEAKKKKLLDMMKEAETEGPQELRAGIPMNANIANRRTFEELLNGNDTDGTKI